MRSDYNGCGFNYISGVAPHAQIIAYDVCDPGGCPNTYSVEAVEQAVIDGVDVINYSIGPNSGVNPYANAVELAMLEALDAGILAAASAGICRLNQQLMEIPHVYKAPS